MLRVSKLSLTIAGILLISAISIIVIINKPQSEPEKPKAVEFVFNDDYFGRKKEPERVRLNETIFTVPESEKTIKPKEPVKPTLQLPPARPTNSFTARTVTYNQTDNNLAFLSDKNNPTVIASREYDLSQIITIDKYIPAVLETAVNSEIPIDRVVARVESNVYGYHPKDVLIPRGSKVIGAFEVMAKHDRKIQIAWHTIITPRGSIIKMDSKSLDSHGASGFRGYLDQRLKDRYGGALFISALNTLANLSVDIQSTRNLVLVDNLARQLIPLGNAVIKENLDVMPVIQIRQGQRFNIIPDKNILFKKLDDLTTQAVFIP